MGDGSHGGGITETPGGTESQRPAATEPRGDRESAKARAACLRTLVVITNGYPSRADPTAFPFVREFAHAVARRGISISVVAPVPVHRGFGSGRPGCEVESTTRGQAIEVFRPRYFSASAVQVGRWNSVEIGQASFERTVHRLFRRGLVAVPDAFYGHFLYPGGATAVSLGMRHGRPAFPMVGDGLLNSAGGFRSARVRRDFTGVAGFMSNSTCLAQMLKDRFELRDGIGVFPNGVDASRFYPRNRTAARARLGLPQAMFLVVCVGQQDLEKGPVRVGEAIAGLDGVAGVFLGRGPVPPRVPNVLFNGPVPHAEVPEWLSAADVFVLPTRWEGSCNAIIEAMACGLPVISSAGEFNDDILMEQVAIRIDPMDVNAIREAVLLLLRNPCLRERMASAAIVWSRRFSSDRRAEAIVSFMEGKMAEARPESVASRPPDAGRLGGHAWRTGTRSSEWRP